MKKKLEILHLEDNDLDAEIIQNILQEEGIECSITRASSKKDYFSAIHRYDYDIILSDNSLPDYDGISALKYAREHKPQIPFIFLSGTIGEDKAVEALRYGARDYVLKQNLNKLAQAIKRVIQESEIEQARIQAEKELRASEEKYRTLAEFSPEMIYVIDPNGYVSYVNKRAAEQFHLTPEKIIGKHLKDIFPPDIAQKNFEGIKRVIETKNFSQQEVFQKFPTGNLWVEARLSPLFDEKNRITGVLGLSFDVTARKQAEQEIINAKELAEEMNRLKSCFLSSMSHELRTPLISVLGFAELLQQELTNTEHLEYVKNIIEGGQRLNSTLSEILEISKLESEKSFLKLQPHNLAEEINKGVKTFLPIAQAKRLFLKTELSHTHLDAHIDGELFGKALFHLVHNGIKFTKEGGVLITLNHEKKHERDWAVTKVIDTGIGIPKKDSDKIFEAFRQASEGIGRSHEGTGIGLTIAKRTVELMKGKIEFESEVGKGSVFSIWLPAVLDENQIMMEVKEKRKTTIIEPPTTKEKGLQKVLVVDDNASNRLFFNHCLSSHVRIIEAEDGISGVTIASKEHFGVVLMDINLGLGISGVEAMHQMRKIPGYIRVPIIAVTAYVMQGDKERFINEGFDDYLAKPFTKDVLVSLVEKRLKKYD